MKGKSRVYDFLVFYLPLNLNIYIYTKIYGHSNNFIKSLRDRFQNQNETLIDNPCFDESILR